MKYIVIWSKNIWNLLEVGTYTTSQKILNSEICNVFKEVSSAKPAFISAKVQKNSNILKYLYFLQ